MSDIVTTAAVHAFMQSADQPAMRDNIGLGQAATPQFSGLTLTGGMTFPSGPIQIGEPLNGIGQTYWGADGISMLDSGAVLEITSQPDTGGITGAMIDYGFLTEATRDAYSPRLGAVCNVQRGFVHRPQVLFPGGGWQDVWSSNGFEIPDNPFLPANNKEVTFAWVNNTTLRITMKGDDSTDRSVDLTLA